MRRIGRVSGYAGGFVFLSLCYMVLRWVLQLAALRVRSNDFKELESSCFGTNSPSCGDEPVVRR
jgi:hypothetical protein